MKMPSDYGDYRATGVGVIGGYSELTPRARLERKVRDSSKLVELWREGNHAEAAWYVEAPLEEVFAWLDEAEEIGNGAR